MFLQCIHLHSTPREQFHQMHSCRDECYTPPSTCPHPKTSQCIKDHSPGAVPSELHPSDPNSHPLLPGEGLNSPAVSFISVKNTSSHRRVGDKGSQLCPILCTSAESVHNNR